ncbi:MAG: hypothetical protein AMJ81_08025 [Phycisphaerae bacterium SM23_33]|nr:MAG: hypothetical protein AMJ81_08025 [Phycisphaerae bacterium SM23_33]
MTLRSLTAVTILAAVTIAFISLIQAADPATAPKPEAKDQPDPGATLAAELEKVVRENLRGCGTEDLDVIASTIHPQSPFAQATQAMMKQLVATYDLKYELVSLDYVGRDKDYALARAKQKTTKVRGPAFRDNVLDIIHIFRQDGKAWKLWTSAALEVQYLDQAGPAPPAAGGA